MSDYKDRFDKWQRDAKEKFEEIDKQLGLKEKIGEGARAVVDTAQKGAEKIKAEAEKSDVGRQAVKVAEETLKTAEETAKKAWNASVINNSTNRNGYGGRAGPGSRPTRHQTNR